MKMKTLRRVWNVVTSLMVAAVVLLAVALVGVRVVGLTPYTVLSGSMEPAYHVGSLIYVKKISPENVTAGMPITFVANENLTIVTHRVTDVEKVTFRETEKLDDHGNPMKDEQGSSIIEKVPLEEPAYYFTTKGDANDTEDGAKVYGKNLLGTPVFSIPYLGYFSSFLSTKRGMIVGACAVLILLILTFLPDLLRKISDDEDEKKGSVGSEKNDTNGRNAN